MRVAGQRALVRKSANRLVLALVSGTRLHAHGHDLRSPGPAAVTIEGARIAGEANFCSPGEVRLAVPKGGTASTVQVVTDNASRHVPLTRDGDALRIRLPAGRCRFGLR